jgi:hypothetical protein
MRPSSSRPFRLLVVLATALTLLAAPMSVSAHGGSYHRADLDVTALIGTVSGGQPVAFDVVLKSDGSDPFDNVKLSVSAPGGSLVTAPLGCSGSGASASCHLGKIHAGASRTLRFVFSAPASAGTLKLTAELKHKFWWSWKTVLKASATAAVVNDPNFFGGWQSAHAAPVTFSTGASAGDNGQTSQVGMPPVGFGYPASLAELDESIVCGSKVYQGFGDAVDMTFANGQEVEPFLTLTLTYKKDVIGWRDPHKIKFVHQLDNGTCQFPPRGCSHWNDGFCFDAWWSGYGSSKKLVIRVELPSNGRGKGV